MSNKYKFLTIFSLMLLLGQVSKAQTYCLKYELFKNTNTVDVRVGLVAEGAAFKLGAGNLQLKYNGASLGNPALLSNILTAKGYKSVSVTQPVSPNLQGTSDKLISLNFNFTGQAGDGLAISEKGINIAVIRFQKGQEGFLPTLRAYNNNTVGTIVYNDDNTHPQLLTSLKNCPVSDVEMPSRWLNLNAVSEKAAKTVILDWSIMSDENCSHFIIERSADGKIFESIGEIKATATLNDYAFIDTKPLKSTAFYRVQQINFDQTESLSDTKQLAFAKNTRLKVYPTIVTNANSFLTIDLPANGSKVENFHIVNASGQTVSTGKIMERVTVEMGSFPTGIYMLTVGGENVKFVKQ